MKKILAVLVVITMILRGSVLPLFAEANSSQSSNIRVLIDNNYVVFNESMGFPFVDASGRTQVPLRATMEAFGAIVNWDNEKGMAYVQKGSTTVYIPINKNYLIVNGTQVENDTSAAIIDGRTYCPIRKVLESFSATLTWDPATKTVLVSSKDVEKTSIKQRNITTMLTTFSNNISYWDCFSNSNRYPYYIYLDNYYGAKDSLPLLQGAESFFRVNIAPSLIGIADKIYNDNAGLDQSKLRAKDILVSMIKKSGSDIINKELLDQRMEIAKNMITAFDASIVADEALYNKLFESKYEKLEAFNQRIESYLLKKVEAGVVPSPKVLMQAEEFIKINNYINKTDLTEKLDKKIMSIYEVNGVWKKLGIGMDIVSGLKIGADNYYQMCDLLQANSYFIDFLDLIETNANTNEVKEAAKDLKENYKIHLKGQLEVVGSASVGTIEALIKDLSWQVSITTLVMDTVLNVGDKIDKLERLRLSSDMACAIDKVMLENINKFNTTSDKAIKDDAVDTIYKYAPYLFALRLEGESNLYNYLKVIGAKEYDIGTNKNNVISSIETLYNVLYKDIGSTADFSSYKEVIKDRFADLVGKFDGTYTASQGTTGLTLEIYKTGNNTAEAKFSFYAVTENNSVPSGVYLMKVNYNPENEEVSLKGYNWLIKPNNYSFVDLQGVLKNGTLQGNVLSGSDSLYGVGEKLGEFILSKSSDIYTDYTQKFIDTLGKGYENQIKILGNPDTAKENYGSDYSGFSTYYDIYTKKVTAISMNSESYITAFGIRFGMTGEQVRTKLGTPSFEGLSEDDEDGNTIMQVYNIDNYEIYIIYEDYSFDKMISIGIYFKDF